MTLLDDPRPISADSHALEGPEVFDGLADRFGDDAPRVVHREGKGDHIVTPNMPQRSRNVAVMALAGTRLDYETLDGVENLGIPRGTESGTEFRMRGRGVPHVRGRGRGDARQVEAPPLPGRKKPRGHRGQRRQPERLECIRDR